MINNLETAIRVLFQPLFPKLAFRARTSSEIYSMKETKQDSLFIQLSLDSYENEPFEDCACSYFDMWYNLKENRFEHVHLKLRSEIRGEGLGRQLVESKEKLAKYLGCQEIRLNLNTNPDFWKHMGYQPKNDYWYKTLL